MGKTSAIEWTDATWNPWQGCHKVSAGCRNCYMYRDFKRFGKDAATVIRSSAQTFHMPLRRGRKALPAGSRIFTCSWSDFFIEEADAWRAEAWEIIKATPQYFYIILTKRPENIATRLPSGWFDGFEYENVALLVSTEDQRTYNDRWPILDSIPAAIKGISAEPLLAEIDLLKSKAHRLPEWVISGGESGANARSVDEFIFRKLGVDTAAHKIAFFHKQNGGSKKIEGHWGGNQLMGGVVIQEFPAAMLSHRDFYWGSDD